MCMCMGVGGEAGTYTLTLFCSVVSHQSLLWPAWTGLAHTSVPLTTQALYNGMNKNSCLFFYHPVEALCFLLQLVHRKYNGHHSEPCSMDIYFLI